MTEFTLSCPAPITNLQTVQMAHGSGGTKMHRLLDTIFLPAFANQALLAQHDLSALVAPAGGPADAIPEDGVVRPGQREKGAASLTWHAAIGGYPVLTVPMGAIDGMPVGLSFIGAPWNDKAVLSYGYAYEQTGYKRQPPEAYKQAVKPN